MSALLAGDEDVLLFYNDSAAIQRLERVSSARHEAARALPAGP